MNNEKKGFWSNIFDSNKALDTTLITAIAGAVAIMVVLRLFDIHEGGDKILTGEIIMALIALPTNLIMYALGKRSGEAVNGNGHDNGKVDKNTAEIERIKQYLNE